MMTLRGERIVPVEPPLPYPRLAAWLEQAKTLTEAAFSACDTAGLNQAAREALVLHLDKRDISMETILAGMLYHVSSEYPHLMRSGYEHGLKAVYASNLNDRYRVWRVTDEESVSKHTEVKAALEKLATHLDNIPPSVEI